MKKLFLAMCVALFSMSALAQTITKQSDFPKGRSDCLL